MPTPFIAVSACIQGRRNSCVEARRRRVDGRTDRRRVVDAVVRRDHVQDRVHAPRIEPRRDAPQRKRRAEAAFVGLTTFAVEEEVRPLLVLAQRAEQHQLLRVR